MRRTVADHADGAVWISGQTDPGATAHHRHARGANPGRGVFHLRARLSVEPLVGVEHCVAEPSGKRDGGS